MKDVVVRFERWDLLEDELLVNVAEQFVVAIVVGHHQMHLSKQENQSVDQDGAAPYVMDEKRAKNDVDRRFLRNEKADEQKEIRWHVRLSTTDPFDRLGYSIPFTFQLFTEADDQHFQAEKRRSLQQIFQLSKRFMRDIGIVQFRRLASPAARPEHQRQEKVQEMSDHRHVADATNE